MKAIVFFSKFETPVYSILRIVTGFLFLWHGSQKLFGFPPSGHPTPLYIVIIGGTIEFFGGLMVMAGFKTRWAAFLCSGEMAYAYWFVHATNNILPLRNGGEMAIIYCFLFLFIVTRGSGAFSIDSLLGKKR